MERLSKNELFLLASELPLIDLVNLCKASKLFNTRVCANQEFWKDKLTKDFPDWYLSRETQTIQNLGNFKNLYIFLHRMVKKDSKNFFPTIDKEIKELVKRIRNIIPLNIRTIKRQKIETEESLLYDIYNTIFDYILIILNNISLGKYYDSEENNKNLEKEIEEKLQISIDKNFWNSLISDLNSFINNIYNVHLHREDLVADEPTQEEIDRIYRSIGNFYRN